MGRSDSSVPTCCAWDRRGLAKKDVSIAGLCSCHVGKARFALELATMSFAEQAQMVDTELTPSERAGPTEGYDAAYQRALVKHAKTIGVKLT